MYIRIKQLLFISIIFSILGIWNTWGNFDFPKETEVHAQTAGEWPMAGANVERSSWTPTEVRGTLKPVWYRPIESYIPPRTQIIAANNTLFLSTSNGLYAFGTDGNERWVYPTAMPLGHSPTIAGGVAYVGGLDHKLHAIDVQTGAGLWTFSGKQGFQTNPLVVNGVVFMGNRDGSFYAIGAHGSDRQGQLIWKYETGGPILYSAAYKDNVVYFASNDSYAYALNAQTGALVWKSDKLPGAGFHSWWPVVYRDWVIFSGSINYRTALTPFGGHFANAIERTDVYPNNQTDPRGTKVGKEGTESGEWAVGTTTIDMSQSNITSNGATTRVTEYFEDDGVIDLNRRDHKSWRRSYFVLNRANGAELTMDTDQDGKKEYAPILWFDTKSGGNRQPPLVGIDNVLYQTNNYMSDPFIAGGHISGWKLGTPYISQITNDWGAVDEPHAYSAGGKLIYWSLCCDRQAGVIDISIPRGAPNPYNHFFINYNLEQLMPGYNEMTVGGNGLYGGRNGSYGWHGDRSAPIPYNGRVYLIMGNALLAFAPGNQPPVQKLPRANIVSSSSQPSISRESVQIRLEEETQKMISSGHLRPGYMSSGILDSRLVNSCGDNLQDYGSSPAETIAVLLRALPHLPVEKQTALRAYIQSEFAAYPPYQYNHIGWQGAAREGFDLPADVAADLVNYPPKTETLLWLWKFNPYSFYTLWKYALEFGNAPSLFLNATASQKLMTSIQTIPPDADLVEMPHALNAYIAGHIGYLELEKLAGRPETAGMRTQLERLLNLRTTTFSKDVPESYLTQNSKRYCRALSVARNFMYMTPELANHMRERILPNVEAAVLEYEKVAPFWFVSKFEAEYGEGKIRHLYDAPSLMRAKSTILRRDLSQLVSYVDIPAFAVGDLSYIDTLVSVLEAQGGEQQAGDLDGDGDIDEQDMNLAISNYRNSFSSADFNNNGLVDTHDIVTVQKSLPTNE
jgi:outer membrane protein assembly factor BamB